MASTVRDLIDWNVVHGLDPTQLRNSDDKKKRWLQEVRRVAPVGTRVQVVSRDVGSVRGTDVYGHVRDYDPRSSSHSTTRVGSSPSMQTVNDAGDLISEWQCFEHELEVIGSGSIHRRVAGGGCECGAQALGIGPGQPGHSDWCRAR